MRILSYRAAALIAALLILPGAARAQWIADGSTQTSQIGSSKNNDASTVNYAVFQQTTTGSSGTLATYLNSAAGAGLKTALGSSVTALENSKYIYFYQAANPVKTTIKEFYVANPGATTIAASANGYVFQQNGSAVTTGALASNPTGGSITGGPSTDLTFTANTGAKGTNPDGTNTFGDTGNPNTEFSLNDSVGIAKGQYSGLMVLGSNNKPMSGEVETGDGGQATAFGVPVPGPEPGTFALLALGLPILGLRYGRRLQNRLKGVAPLAA